MQHILELAMINHQVGSACTEPTIYDNHHEYSIYIGITKQCHREVYKETQLPGSLMNFITVLLQPLASNNIGTVHLPPYVVESYSL